MLSHVHDIIIDSGVGAPGLGKYVVDGLNATDKRYLSISMKTVQLTNATPRPPKWKFIHQQKIQT